MLAPHRKSKVSIPSKAPARASSDTAPSTDDHQTSPMTVLPSSTDLFFFYGQSLEQCAKLSTGQPLFDLCTLHKKWLRIYAGKSSNILTISYKHLIFVYRRSPGRQYQTVGGFLGHPVLILISVMQAHNKLSEIDRKPI